MAIITTAHVKYQINRVVILPAGATNGKPGAVRVIATEIDHNLPANLAWRADVYFTRDASGGWYFSSWNIGTHLNADQSVAKAIEAGLADYINEIDLDARDAELTDRADAATDAEAAAPGAMGCHPYRAETIARALAQRIYITDAMVGASHTLRDVAADFIKTYRGTNSFIQDVAIRVADTGVVTIGQMRGALNVMVAEARAERDQALRAAEAAHFEMLNAPADQPAYLDLRSTSERTVDEAGAPPAAEDQPAADARRLPNGTYTIILDAATDEYRTIRLADAPESFNAAPGTQIASYLSGADNDASYTGFAFVLGKTITIWKKYRVNGANPADSKIKIALAELIDSADPISHMREYVLRSARCGVCGRKLTTPDSIRMGIGPICASNLQAQGYTFTMPATARAILAAVKTIDAADAATQPKTREDKIAAAKAAADAINELFD